jgi:hypothetical protein
LGRPITGDDAASGAASPKGFGFCRHLQCDTSVSSDEEDFTRFAISYGLSIPFGEGPEIRLPSQFEDAEKPQQWVPPGG